MLLESIDFFRIDANRLLDPERRSELGQFLTPPPTARLMASMFEAKIENAVLLDAGAGVGSLTAAFVNEMCQRSHKPKTIHAKVYEIDAALVKYLNSTLYQCHKACEKENIAFDSEVIVHDFIDHSTHLLRHEMFAPVQRFNCAILNPPYKKIHSDSQTRSALREIGIETSNLYTAFLSVALMLLAPGGELVAITPRSFCNGPYFKPFRKLLLETFALKRIHVFESRQVAFKEDDVLQENVIFYGIKGSEARKSVTISSSEGPEDDLIAVREISYDRIVQPKDKEYFIHIVPDELGASIAEQVGRLYWTLKEHEIEVSTGRVVDFRAVHWLRDSPEKDTAPLIYPRNLENGFVRWPILGKKPQGISISSGTDELLVPNGTYVLVKRFSTKEESRRVVAAIYDSTRFNAEQVGFENHLNYFHRNGRGLPPILARGLAAFLNSTLVDLYFRQFNGHTQVNATDLRNLRYPTRSQIEALGSKIGDNAFPEQEVLDRYVEEALNLPDATSIPDPVKAKKRIDEALNILKSLDLPREQQNERSALTLLALLDLKPEMPWAAARDPLMGITPMMEFFDAHYGKKYAPNTRETVRRQTIHQFVEAGMVVSNPDNLERPTNSPFAVYQIEQGLLKLLRTYDKKQWRKSLQTYLASIKTLKEKYARERQMKRIPVKVAPDRTIALSPGGAEHPC